MTLKDTHIELIEFYRNNPVMAAADLLHVDLPVVQGRILESFWFKPYTIVTAGRGSGKSFLLSVYACLRALLYTEERIGIISSSFRQARSTFTEVKYRWESSPILREATIRKPTFGADLCYLEFKKPDNHKPSLICALPIGDGSKIRGMRFYSLLLDEMAQIPEDIIDMVIRPMSATAANPMERVRRMERLKRLREMGVENVEDFYKDDQVNKLIGCSSAFFSFNHMYRKIESYQGELEKGSKKHAVHFVSFKDMPEGFLDQDNIDEARRSMSKALFDMEYGGIWQSDSEGIFKASLLETVKTQGCPILSKGREGFRYIMAVDPARVSDGFSMIVIECTPEGGRLVHAVNEVGMKFPKMADLIMEKSKLFDNVFIIMDAGAGGGGLALKDLLECKDSYGDNAIIDMDDPDKEETRGRKILRMYNPSSAENAKLVYSTLNLLEQKRLLLPYPPLKGNEAEDVIYSIIEKLYKQLLNIKATETRAGVAHFDVPGGGHGAMKKDLFTAFVLAGREVHRQIYDAEGEQTSIYDFTPVIQQLPVISVY